MIFINVNKQLDYELEIDFLKKTIFSNFLKRNL